MNSHTQRIVIIEGHPDPGARHFCHALADAYQAGALEAGHAVTRFDAARLDFPLLRSQHDWEHGATPAALVPLQQAIADASHVVLVFPLWLGDMPALVKALLEQVARPGFAFKGEGGNPFAHKALAGRSARVVVTMGMPAEVYRWYFMAHAVRSLERNILGFVGIAPVRRTLIGMVGNLDAGRAQRWLARMRALGASGQ
ncbi:NAD(P)H-dependent oxidoreductase [Pseudoduganella ginsengisoli]|uniref:Flavodoxin family protein n=1 Tax=Pseudoduganella ginsengisoli TaxID=1462440 RepID=A0A6L6Q5K3_9BURK|nr:flavodoxin family protein [Pseudoduganella ginsengisoli]